MSETGATRTAAKGAIVVGVADLAVTDDPNAKIVTYALGSCIGVTVYDPVAKVAGMLHFMLPSGKVNAEKAENKPAMFGDTGIPMLFRAVYDLGAVKERLIVCAAGGAEIIGDSHFRVGPRNRTLLRKIFWKNNILLAADDTGGNISRTVTIKVSDGSVTVRNRGQETMLWPV